jgi:GTPase SAR1 family protein
MMSANLRPKKQVVKMKVCVIGEAGAGKTNFIHRLIQSEEEEEPTEEYEVSVYCLDSRLAVLEIQLWDCSGRYRECHKYLHQAYFRNSSAALLIFDITCKDWQQQAHYWISEAYDNHCYLVYAIATNIEKYLENR